MLELLEDRRLMTASLAAVDDFVPAAVNGSVVNIDVLANDVSPDGPATIVDWTQGTNGTVALAFDNTLVYAPFNAGTDVFTYTIAYGTEYASASVSVTVIPSAGDLYTTYVTDITAADYAYTGAVLDAAATRQTDINIARTTAEFDAAQLYADYQLAVTQATQTYEAAVADAEAVYQSAVTSADATQETDTAAALAIYDAALATSQTVYDDAVMAAEAAYQADLLAADAAYDAAVAPYQAALDQAIVDADSAQVFFASADAALSATIASATAERDASQSAALVAYDAAPAHAEQAHLAALEYAAWLYDGAMFSSYIAYAATVDPVQAARDQADAAYLADPTQAALFDLWSADAALASAIAQATTDRDAAQAAALVAYLARVASADETLANAPALATQNYQDALTAADAAYAVTVAPYQTARDDGDAANQSAQAALGAAVADLSAAIGLATSGREVAIAAAATTREAALAAAVQDRNAVQGFVAHAAYDATVAAADEAYQLAELAAGTAYDAAMAPYQTAWEQALVYAEAAAATLASAESALSAVIATATAERDASYATALDQAAVDAADAANAAAIAPYQTARDEADAANQSAQAALAAADTAWTAAAAAAMTAYELAIGDAATVSQAAYAVAAQVLVAAPGYAAEAAYYDAATAAKQAYQAVQFAADAASDASVAPYQAAWEQAMVDAENAAAALGSTEAALSAAIATAAAQRDSSIANALDQAALDTADAIYAGTVGPFQTAREQAEAAYQSAQGALIALNAVITAAIASAMSPYELALADAATARDIAAGQAYVAAQGSAFVALHASRAAADASWTTADQVAWTACLGATAVANAAMVAAENTAWNSFDSALAGAQSNLAANEAFAQTQFDSRLTAALFPWNGSELTAWTSYTLNMVNIPAAPPVGPRRDAPADVQIPAVQGQRPAMLAMAQNIPPGMRQFRPEAEAEPIQDREFWRTQPQPALNISGRSDRAFVRRAIDSLETTFRLTTIPSVEPAAAPPAFVTVTGDRSVVATAHGPIGMPVVMERAFVTAAQLARINLRVNLINLKQGLVDRIYNMVVDFPPPGTQWNAVDRVNIANMANVLANDLIRMVDLFLRTHPGASPEQGSRPAWGMVGNRFSWPWCPDWTGAMSAWVQHAVVSRMANHPANRYLQFEWGVSRNDVFPASRLQHNFLIIKPIGHQVRVSTGLLDADARILLFDPWRDLLPRAYSPTPWILEARRTPTRLLRFQATDDFTWYDARLADLRFSDPHLRLGEFFPARP